MDKVSELLENPLIITAHKTVTAPMNDIFVKTVISAEHSNGNLTSYGYIFEMSAINTKCIKITQVIFTVRIYYLA